MADYNSGQDDMHTPLSRVRGLGSAKEGTDHFWRQRLTAIANVPLILFFIWVVISLNGASHAEVVAYLSKPWVAIIMLMVLGAGIYHMKLGMQVVIEDYVHGGSGQGSVDRQHHFLQSPWQPPVALQFLNSAFGG